MITDHGYMSLLETGAGIHVVQSIKLIQTVFTLIISNDCHVLCCLSGAFKTRWMLMMDALLVIFSHFFCCCFCFFVV